MLCQQVARPRVLLCGARSREGHAAQLGSNRVRGLPRYVPTRLNGTMSIGAAAAATGFALSCQVKSRSSRCAAHAAVWDLASCDACHSKESVKIALAS